MSIKKLTGVGAAALVLAGSTASAQFSPREEEESWERIADGFGGAMVAGTQPSRDVTMAFTFATEVREILVQPGERVTKGQVLARARDADVIAAMELQQTRADNEISLNLAKKQRELADVRYQRLLDSGQYTPMELDERRVEAEAAALQVEQAIMNQTEERLRLLQLEGSYERYRLEAPFDGIVEDVMIEVGQGVRETDPAIRIVNTEKLWLEAFADLHETRRLNLGEGDTAWVLVDMPDEPVLLTGEVLFVSPVANFTAQTRRVRVELDNPEGWGTGYRARVRFTPPPEEYMQYARAGATTAAAEEAETGAESASAGGEGEAMDDVLIEEVSAP